MTESTPLDGLTFAATAQNTAKVRYGVRMSFEREPNQYGFNMSRKKILASALVVRVVFSRSCDFPGVQESQVRKASIRVATDVLRKAIRTVDLSVTNTRTWARHRS